MPTRTNRKTKMPKKRSTKVFVEKNIIYNSKQSFSDPASLRMVIGNDAEPLEMPYPDYCDYQAVPGKLRRQMTKGHDDDHFYNKSTTKVCRDDFILFRKRPHPQPSGEDHFSKVSDEIILHIFQWLPKPTLAKCSSVCKRWRDLSYDDSLWKRYDFGRRYVKSCVLEKLLLRGVVTLRLAMSNIVSPVFSDVINQIPQWSSSLQYLDLTMTAISIADLTSLLSVCCNLKKLSLEQCELDDECCKNIALNSELTVLNMAMCSGLTATGLLTISVNCVELKEWNLAWTNLASGCMDTFLCFMPRKMERLNLSGHRESLNDNGLIQVLNRCPNIIELDVSDCPLLSQDSFEVLVRKCPNLEHLHSSRSYHIPAECNKLLKEMKHFKNLEVFRTLTDKSLASLREFMPNVQINQNVFSTIARPTTGIRRTSIWGIRVRD